MGIPDMCLKVGNLRRSGGPCTSPIKTFPVSSITHYHHFSNVSSSIFIYSSPQRCQNYKITKTQSMPIFELISLVLFGVSEGTFLPPAYFWKAWQPKTHTTKAAISCMKLGIVGPCEAVQQLYKNFTFFIIVTPEGTHQFLHQCGFKATYSERKQVTKIY